MKFLILFSILLSTVASAQLSEDSNLMPIGHNLDMTGYTLRGGHCTVGFQFAGCGVSNQFTLGTSPWLWTSYNSYNVFSRYSYDKTADHQNALQFAYIKSDGTKITHVFIYEMELVWLSFIRTFYQSPGLTTHVNASMMYYFDEVAPFSLRRPNFYKDPFQFNLGFLTEIKLVGNLYLNAEVALTDFVKKYFHIQTGMSLEYRGGWWLFHFGMSQSQTINALFNSYRFDAQQFSWGSNLVDEYSASIDYAIHPEFALQFYF